MTAHYEPLVSICMPTYKRTKFIRKAIESCLAQTYGNFEIIVHDDTPDASIRDIVATYNSSKIRYIQNVPPLGLIGKLNNCLEIARGEWAVILCDDDVFEKEFLERLIALARTNSTAALLRSRSRTIDENGRELSVDILGQPFSRPDEFLRTLFLPRQQTFKVNLTGFMFRPAQLRGLGGFLDLYRAWHADRLAWALLGANGPTLYEPQVLCSLRVHSSSVTSGLSPDYKAAVQADLTMKQVVELTLDRLLSQANRPDIKDNLEHAKASFKAYMQRHLSRSLDHGFLAALADRSPRSKQDLQALTARMDDLGVRFRSGRIYRALGLLPPLIRQPAARAIRNYKQRHWMT